MKQKRDELTAAYIRDLEIEIECNAREIAAGRTDLSAYDAKIRHELKALRAADNKVIITRHGIPRPD